MLRPLADLRPSVSYAYNRTASTMCRYNTLCWCQYIDILSSVLSSEDNTFPLTRMHLKPVVKITRYVLLLGSISNTIYHCLYWPNMIIIQFW